MSFARAYTPSIPSTSTAVVAGSQTVHAASPPAGLTAVTANGVADDKARIQACLDYVKTTWGSGTVVLPGKTLKCLSGLSVPEDVQLRGVSKKATTLDFSAAGSSVTAISCGGHRTNPVRDLALKGPNGTDKIGYPTNTSCGINLHGVHTHLEGISIVSFFTGLDLTNDNTFFFHGDNIDIGCAGVGIDMNSGAEHNGGTVVHEVGERMALTNSVIYNSVLGVDMVTSGTTLFASGCSFDYLGTHFRVIDAFLHLVNCHLETGYAPSGNGNWGTLNRHMMDFSYTARATFTGCRFEVRDPGVYAAITPFNGPTVYNSGNVRWNDCTWYGLIGTTSNGDTQRQFHSRDMVAFDAGSTLTKTIYSPFASKWNAIHAYPAASDAFAHPAGWSVRVASTDVSSNAGAVPTQAVTLERVPPTGASAPYPAMWVVADY